jgi:8-oxo-dGTP pyrophosphatase MutT (NUDIX family)
LTDKGFRVPDWLAGDARAFYASGRPPAVPKTAATVLLLRPAQPAFEVYAIRRAATMAFASGMYAFPGGSVDPRDAAHPVPMVGPTPAQWARWLGQDEAGARAVVCAAVREVFEECGVLLAGPSPEAVVGDVSGDDWEAQRVALVARELGFADFLDARGLMLRADLITPWARWLTPEFEPRRFDTYFFLARLPIGQVTRDVGGEADLVRWVRPADALAERLPMLPPTAITLGQLAGFGSMDEALARANHDLTAPVVPVIELDDDGGRLLVPGA